MLNQFFKFLIKNMNKLTKIYYSIENIDKTKKKLKTS